LTDDSGATAIEYAFLLRSSPWSSSRPWKPSGLTCRRCLLASRTIWP